MRQGEHYTSSKTQKRDCMYGFSIRCTVCIYIYIYRFVCVCVYFLFLFSRVVLGHITVNDKKGSIRKMRECTAARSI